MSLLNIQDLQVAFHTEEGNITAVNKLNFDLQQGETLGIVGESGSGKSQTAFAIMGLLAKNGRAQGSVKFDGREILNLSEGRLNRIRAREIAMIFQDPMTSLNPYMKVGAQLAEVLVQHQGMSKAAARAEALRMLEAVKIPEAQKRMDMYPHECSGGMRQRVMIAMALLCRPKLLIADEPTTALDVTIQAQILELMNDLRHKLGMSIIMITHDLGVVAQMCEKIAVMYAGHIVEYGTTDEIFYNPQHEYTKGLINSIPKLNAEEKERLVPIEGQPVDLLNPPAGCPFAPRCKSCMKVCLNKMPPRTELSDTHYTYCWLRQKEEFEKGGKA